MPRRDHFMAAGDDLKHPPPDFQTHVAHFPGPVTDIRGVPSQFPLSAGDFGPVVAWFLAAAANFTAAMRTFRQTWPSIPPCRAWL